VNNSEESPLPFNEGCARARCTRPDILTLSEKNIGQSLMQFVSAGKSTAAQRLGGDLRAQVAQFFFFESACSSFAVDCAFETLDLPPFAMSRHVRSCYLKLKVA
jgi:hypothetical protein